MHLSVFRRMDTSWISLISVRLCLSSLHCCCMCFHSLLHRLVSVTQTYVVSADLYFPPLWGKVGAGVTKQVSIGGQKLKWLQIKSTAPMTVPSFPPTHFTSVKCVGTRSQWVMQWKLYIHVYTSIYLTQLEMLGTFFFIYSSVCNLNRKRSVKVFGGCKSDFLFVTDKTWHHKSTPQKIHNNFNQAEMLWYTSYVVSIWNFINAWSALTVTLYLLNTASIRQKTEHKFNSVFLCLFALSKEAGWRMGTSALIKQAFNKKTEDKQQ